MSFQSNNRTISGGDIVGLYSGFNRLQHVKVEPGKVAQTKFGALRHNDLIGQKYGSKVSCSKGWMFVIGLTPEWWTLTLPHRTQILYTTDISMIILQLDLKPGSVVVEAGTGSGSLSHAFIRTVAPNGHLHTFDFHENRCQTARGEFAEHGLSELVTAGHIDVCSNGFGLENVADAVFLDLPSPWEAVTHVKAAIKKKGGRVCSFSPCIEQVQRTCEKMNELGFEDINTLECLVKDYNIQTMAMSQPDFGDDEKEDYKLPADEPSVGRHVKSKDIEERVSRAAKKRGANVSKLPPDTIVHQFKTAVPRYTMPGHTGFLTFATVYN